MSPRARATSTSTLSSWKRAEPSEQRHTMSIRMAWFPVSARRHGEKPSFHGESFPELPDPFHEPELPRGVEEPPVGGDQVDLQIVREGHVSGIIGRNVAPFAKDKDLREERREGVEADAEVTKAVHRLPRVVVSDPSPSFRHDKAVCHLELEERRSKEENAVRRMVLEEMQRPVLLLFIGEVPLERHARVDDDPFHPLLSSSSLDARKTSAADTPALANAALDSRIFRCASAFLERRYS